jgi:hypothetical protein
LADPTLLIFENAAPFMLGRRVLTNCPRPAIVRLACGAGKQLLKATRYLPMIEPPTVGIQYVGDLAGEGLAIAAEFQRATKSIAVRPTTHFHVAMPESAVRLESPGWLAVERRARAD